MKQMSIEAALLRLEEINKALECGTLPLSDALKLYEEGAGLLRLCHETLENAKVKIEEIALSDIFEEDSDDEDEDEDE